MAAIEIINAEALRVGPDERLIISAPDLPHDELVTLVDHLGRMGLTNRVLVVAMDGIEFSVVSAGG